MKKNRTPSFLRPARHAPRTSLRAVHWIKLLILFLFACQLDSRAASVTLLWDPNPEPDNALYRLYVGILSIKAGNPPLMGFPTEKTIYTVEGLDYLRTYYFVVTAENNDHLESGYSNEVIVQLALPTPLGTTGSITREVWTGISGYGVSSIPLGTAANFSNTPPSFEAPTNWAEAYGTRMRGYITAPATGNYTFWIAGDDNSELWLSPNDNSANKMRIGLVPGWTNSRQWDKYSTQKSAAINLTQGQRYYVEALQKEGGNADNLAVGWAKPGESTFAPSEVIPGSVLSPLF